MGFKWVCDGLAVGLCWVWGGFGVGLCVGLRWVCVVFVCGFFVVGLRGFVVGMQGACVGLGWVPGGF